MTCITVKLIDALALPEGDPLRAGIPPWCSCFRRPDLPADVAFKDAVSNGCVVAVSVSDLDAERADVQAAIDRAKTS